MTMIRSDLHINFYVLNSIIDFFLFFKERSAKNEKGSKQSVK